MPPFFALDGDFGFANAAFSAEAAAADFFCLDAAADFLPAAAGFFAAAFGLPAGRFFGMDFEDGAAFSTAGCLLDAAEASLNDPDAPLPLV